MVNYYGSYQNVMDTEVLLRMEVIGWESPCILYGSVVFKNRYAYRGKGIVIYLFLRPDVEPTPLKELYFFMRSFGSSFTDEDRDGQDPSFFYRTDENISQEQSTTRMTYDLLRYNTAERDILVHIDKIDKKLMPCKAGINYWPWSMAFNLHVDEGVVIHSRGFSGYMSVKVGDHFEDLYYDTMPDNLLCIKHPETGEYTIPEGIHITKITANKK